MGKGSCSILTEHKTQCMLLMDLQICYLHGFKCAQGFFIHTNFSSHRLILGSTLSQLMFTFSIPKMHILSCSPQTGKDIADISRVSWWKTLSVLRNCNGAKSLKWSICISSRCNRSIARLTPNLLNGALLSLASNWRLHKLTNGQWPLCSCKWEDLQIVLH